MYRLPFDCCPVLFRLCLSHSEGFFSLVSPVYCLFLLDLFNAGSSPNAVTQLRLLFCWMTNCLTCMWVVFFSLVFPPLHSQNSVLGRLYILSTRVSLSLFCPPSLSLFTSLTPHTPLLSPQDCLLLLPSDHPGNSFFFFFFFLSSNSKTILVA